MPFRKAYIGHKRIIKGQYRDNYKTKTSLKAISGISEHAFDLRVDLKK